MSEPQDKVDVGSLKDTFLECPVCVEHFNQTDRRPRLLHSCLHAFCTQCLQQLLKKEGRGKITCPLCRKVEKVTGNADTLEVDSLRDKLVEFLQIKQDKKVLCSECLEKTAAVSRCEECQSYLCKECDFVHRRHRVSRDHSILSLNDVLNQPIQSFGKGHFCPNHPKHHLEFYCATEEKLCCVSCTVLDHRDHALQKLEEAATTRKEELDTKIKQVHAHANRLREERKDGTQELKFIEEAKARSILDINRIFDDLKQRLDNRKRKLIENVQRNSSSLSSVINKTMASHEQTLAMIESTDTYFAQAKQKADAVEMLEIYPSIKRSIDSLSVPRQSSRTSNEDPYNLQFKPTKSEDIHCLIGEFGTFTKLPKRIFTEDQAPTHLDSQTPLQEIFEGATPTEAAADVRPVYSTTSEFTLQTAVSMAGHIPLPGHWSPMTEEQFVSEVQLKPEDKEYKLVARQFNTGVKNRYTIVEIKRIQNSTLYLQYVMFLHQMATQNPGMDVERHLWHGTNEDAVTSINIHGFSRSYVAVHLYGKGTYFAVSPSYTASSYCLPNEDGIKHFYYASVLTGHFTEGKQDMVAPPSRGLEDPNVLYNSLVDNVDNPNMFVVFNDVQAYPKYLITFRE